MKELKPEFATHSIQFAHHLAYIRRKIKIRSKSGYSPIGFSLDGCYGLVQAQKIPFKLELVYDLDTLLPTTKPVLYLYPVYHRETFEDFDAYYANLFWETEIFSEHPVLISDAACQKLERARTPLKGLKECTDEFHHTNLNLLTLYWFNYKTKHSLDEPELLEFIDLYNRSICSMYNIDYEKSKNIAWKEGKQKNSLINSAKRYKWDKTILYI